MSDRLPRTFHLKVVTPRRLLCEVDAEYASLPTLEGAIGILPGHRPLYTGIGDGLLTCRIGGEEGRYRIRGGFAQIGPEEVVVMTEMSEDEDEPSPEKRG